MTYEQLLARKKKRVQDAGFTVQESNLNPHLFDFQRHIVTTALRKGRYAIFADCGLGKTLMQLEWANHVTKHTDSPVLILTPLAVSGQTIQEGAKIKTMKEINNFDGSKTRTFRSVEESLRFAQRMSNLGYCTRFAANYLDLFEEWWYPVRYWREVKPESTFQDQANEAYAEFRRADWPSPQRP